MVNTGGTKVEDGAGQRLRPRDKEWHCRSARRMPRFQGTPGGLPKPPRPPKAVRYRPRSVFHRPGPRFWRKAIGEWGREPPRRLFLSFLPVFRSAYSLIAI